MKIATITAAVTIDVDIEEERIKIISKELIGDSISQVENLSRKLIDDVEVVIDQLGNTLLIATQDLAKYRVKVDGIGKIGDFTISIEPPGR